MESINIKVHPPWYARGTPIINTRDGPQMALSEKTRFAIREGPSARGNPVEVRSQKSVVGSQNHDSYRMEDQSRGNPGGKTRLWLTLKTTFSNTQNRVYGQWYAQTRRVETIIDDKIFLSNKTRRIDKIIAMAKIEKSQTRRVAMIVEIEMKHNQKTRKVEMIIDEKMEWRNYHPAGVSDPNRLLCYNLNIPVGIKPKTRRVAMIIENDMTFKPKTRRVDKIIDEKMEWRNYHPVGVSDANRLLCYNHNIPIGIKPKTQRVETIIDEKMEWRNYHTAGVSFLHRNSYYNHNIPLGLKTKPTIGRINLIAI